MNKKLFKYILVWILTLEARLVLFKYKPHIIAITGSVGKTSAKDAIYAALSKHEHVRRSEKSFNSEIGIPLTILGCPNAWYNPFLWIKNIIEGILLLVFKNHYPQWLILEVGADRPGDIGRIAAWLVPDIVVLTRIPDVPVHVEFFDSLQQVIEEKKKLVSVLSDSGLLIFNRDDPHVSKIAKEFRGETFSYGLVPGADFVGRDDQIFYEQQIPRGIAFTVEYIQQKREEESNEGKSESDENEGDEMEKKKESAVFKLYGALGRQLIYASLAACAIGKKLGINLVSTAQALTVYEPPVGRMRILEGIKESIILDDSYNSSPVAAIEALVTLKELRVSGKKIAILGDMLEIGAFTMEEHKKLGKLAAETVDVLCTVGVRARSIAEGALSARMSPKKIFQYEESQRAGKELENILERGDVVLMKGSQSVRMERAVEEIMAQVAQKEKLLVRQEQEWLSKE